MSKIFYGLIISSIDTLTLSNPAPEFLLEIQGKQLQLYTYVYLNNKNGYTRTNIPEQFIFIDLLNNTYIQYNDNIWIQETYAQCPEIFTTNESASRVEMLNRTNGQGITGPRGPQGDQGPVGITGEMGPPGSTGMDGLQGLFGFQGAQGNIGITGPIGNTGSRGLIGFQGSQGIVGITGPQGIQGPTGNSGNLGNIGPQGITGFQGDDGYQGPQGYPGINIGGQGDTGDIGIQGNTGPTGPIGLQGDIGYTGIQGYQGKIGNDGATGPMGITGYQGARGPQGMYISIQGAQGNTGPKGLLGFQGDIGQTGPDGYTGYQGDQGDIGMQGPPSDDPSTIVGPTGPTGEGGAQGNRGDIGDIGVKGSNGFQGLQGNTGHTGPIGLQGNKGPQGYVGEIGYTGAQGAQGNTGPQGPAGDVGIPGYQGYQGAQGLTGDKGEQGLQGPQGIKGYDGPGGEIGPEGNQGLDGPRGPQGPPGSANPCTIASKISNLSGNTYMTIDTGVSGDYLYGNAPNGLYVYPQSTTTQVSYFKPGKSFNYIANQSALRVGEFYDNSISDPIGLYSVGIGKNVIARQLADYAVGESCLVTGNIYNANNINSVGGASAIGYKCRATRTCAHSHGSEAAANNFGSHAEGYQTVSSGYASHAEGYQTVASGSYTHAEGYSCSSSVEGSHSQGYNCRTNARYSHVQGYGATNTGEYSHVEGMNNFNGLNNAHIEGINNSNIYESVGSHIEGGNNVCYHGYTYIEGRNNICHGKDSSISHMEGNDNIMYGNLSHIEGTLNELSGPYANVNCLNVHMEGYRNVVDFGNYAHVEGGMNKVATVTATENYAHCEGYGNTANGVCPHVEGTNNSGSNYTHIQGENNSATNPYTYVSGINLSSISGGYVIPGVFLLGANGSFHNLNYGSYHYSLQCVVNGSIQYILNNLGNLMLRGALTSGYNADYAEYFEWMDGNPNNEYRAGYFVELSDGGHIQINTNKQVLGVVSQNSGFIGDSYIDGWVGKFQRDEFGKLINVDNYVHTYTNCVHVDTFHKCSNGCELCANLTTHTSDIILSKEHALDYVMQHYDVSDEQLEKIHDAQILTTGILNPDYDPSIHYKSREDRKEWDCVGLLGKLYVRQNGQCQVGNYCSAENGIAVPGNKWKVIQRVSDTVIRIMFNSIDENSLNTIQSQCSQLENNNIQMLDRINKIKSQLHI